MKRLFLLCGLIWAFLFLSSLYFMFLSDPPMPRGWFEVGRTIMFGIFTWLFLYKLQRSKITGL